MGAVAAGLGEEKIMSSKNLRPICLFTLVVLLAAPALQAAGGLAHVSPTAGTGVPTAWELAASLWQLLFPAWSHPGRSLAPRAGLRPGEMRRDLLPACDAGVSLDPSGRCAKSIPQCEVGVSLDPNGRCSILPASTEEGVSLDPSGRSSPN